MRSLFVALALVSLLASPAGAGTAFFEPLWTMKNGNPIAATPTVVGALGDVFGLSLFLTPGSEGVILYSVSISYNNLVLEILTAEEILPAEFDGRVALGITVDVEKISSFDGLMDFGEPGPTGSTPLLIGTAVARVRVPLVAATTLSAGFFGPADGCQNNASGPCSSFGTATIIPIPEPGTATLLGMGLTLIGASRRRNVFGGQPRRRS